MARSTMATLITRMRTQIGDPAGASQVFTDDELQDFLDERRFDVDEAQLVPYPTTIVGPVVSYFDYYSPHKGTWEENEVLKDGANAVITPATADRISGHWTFSVNQVPPVFITGRIFDLYGSCYSACTAWAAKVALEFDCASDNQTFDRTGKREGLLALAREFARRAVPPGRRPEWRAIYW